MNEWIQGKLGDFITLQRGYDLPAYDREQGTIPVVTSSGISDTHSVAKAKGPGVVMGRYGTIGQVFYIETDYWPHNTSLFVRDFKGNHPQFIYYFLKTLHYQAHNDKTSVPGLNRNDLHLIDVLMPLPKAQRPIAEILGSLDDKIEANRRMNETLEATARAIFKSWFVDFDPVHAKARGETPHGMDAETAALFPDSFEDSELGLIPRGWRVEPIGDHVKATKGLSYKGEYLVDNIEDGIPMHNLNSINEWGTYKFDGIKFYSGEYQPRHEVKPGDLIVANTEQGFNLLLIASPAIVPAVFGSKGIISHHVYKVEIKRKSPLTRLFLYYRIMMSPFRDLLQGYTNGTTVNMLPADAFEKPQFVIPPEELTHCFESIVAPMLEQIEHIYGESRTLAETRDALLPRLVSGELRLGEVQQ